MLHDKQTPVQPRVLSTQTTWPRETERERERERENRERGERDRGRRGRTMCLMDVRQSCCAANHNMYGGLTHHILPLPVREREREREKRKRDKVQLKPNTNNTFFFLSFTRTLYPVAIGNQTS